MPVPAFPPPTEARREEGSLQAPDGLRLAWVRYVPPAPRAAVAVLPGGGDHAGRYPGITAALVRAGLEVALLDFRGHGRSEGKRWHVARFEEYLGDLDALVAAVRRAAGGRSLFLLGHSMGGLVAALWAIAAARPVSGLVLSSPYLKLALEPPRLKVFFSLLAGRLVPALPVSVGLDPADLTADPEMQRWTAEDPLYGRKTTPRWFSESSRAQDEVRHRAGELRVPLLVLLGSGDRIADPAAGRAFQTAAGSQDKDLKVYPGLRHELFNEVGRDRPIADTVAWISARVTEGETR